MNLTEFLLARIAEDEAVARAAVSISPCQSNGGHYVENHAVIAEVERAEDAPHIARHDPARVLAECEAKRRIVDMSDGGFDVWNGGEVRAVQQHLDKALALLALPYADHEDHDPAWRP